MKTNLYDRTRFEQIKATGTLPSPKGAALRIIHLTQSEKVSLGDLDQAVRADPAFVARLIKAANAIHPHERRPVVSIRDALAVMGISAVRGLALGFSLLSAHRKGSCPHFDYGRFWSHSLVMALAFQAISRHTRSASLDEAFSIGLLARIGELALATLYPESYGKHIKKTGVEPEMTVANAEHADLALTHNELTAALITDWGFPAIYIEPIFFHEQPDLSGFAEGTRGASLTQSLALARLIADICLSHDDERVAMMSRLQLLGGQLKLDADTLNQLCDSVTAQWPEWAGLLEVHTESVPSFDELARAAESSSTAMEAMGEDRLRILVVVDDRTTRLLLKAIIEAAGYNVIDAETGEDGLNLALENKPDIVIAGWMSQGMSGLELVRSLRKTSSGNDMYIIYLAAMDDEDSLVQAFDAGADDIIQKPLRPRIITARLLAGKRFVSLLRSSRGDQAESNRIAAELAISNRQLQESAHTDIPAGLPNRHQAKEKPDQE